MYIIYEYIYNLNNYIYIYILYIITHMSRYVDGGESYQYKCFDQSKCHRISTNTNI